MYLSRQTLPAFLYMALGGLMMLMPFIIAHSGYIGDVLVADGSLGAPFDKALILIGQESADGSIGIILNKPLTEKQLLNLSSFMRDSGIPVGYGGPLEVSEKIFVVEEKKSNFHDGKSSFDITAWDDAVRTTPDLLDKIRESLKKGEQRYRVFTGFAGWGALQLEWEILLKHKWHSIVATHDLVFQNSPEAQWDALDHRGKTRESPPLNQI
jgi:putative AlgH/UPF0301 family transcriptional regulator